MLNFVVFLNAVRTKILKPSFSIIFVGSALFANPALAAGKDTHTYRLISSDSLTIEYRQGSMVATSKQPGSEVSIIFPQSADPGVAFVRIIVANNGQSSINFGPDNVYASGLRFADYDKMAEAFGKIEASNRFWAGVQALGNSLQAMDAGRKNGVYSYSGQINSLSGGPSYNYSGLGVYQYYDANAAGQARNIANLQKPVIAAQASQSATDSSAILERQLRINTIYPGQALSSEITLAGIKKGIRKLKEPSRFYIQLTVGNEVHSFTGLFGPLGMALVAP